MFSSAPMTMTQRYSVSFDISPSMTLYLNVFPWLSMISFCCCCYGFYMYLSSLWRERRDLLLIYIYDIYIIAVITVRCYLHAILGKPFSNILKINFLAIFLCGFPIYTSDSSLSIRYYCT